MTPRGKRRYVSEVRARRAAETRAQIVSAALDLFSERGYGPTTMADIAKAAGVSVETVYANGPKASLVQAAVRVAVFGMESDRSVLEYDVGARAVAAASPEEFAEILVDFAAQRMVRAAPVWAALETAADSDPEACARRDELVAGGVSALDDLVGLCAARGWLAGDWPKDERVALLYAVASPAPYSRIATAVRLDGEAHRRLLRHVIDLVLFGRV